MECQCTGDGDPLLLANRQEVRRTMATRPHLDCLQGLANPALDLLARQANVFRPKGDVIGHRGRHDLVLWTLENQRDLGADVWPGCPIAGIPPIHLHLTMRGQKQPIDMPGQGRLAGPIGTDQGNELTGRQGKINAS